MKLGLSVSHRKAGTEDLVIRGIGVKDLLCCASFFVSERVMILPTKDGELVAFDPTTGMTIGSFDMQHRYGIYTLHAHPETRSLYAIIAEPTGTAYVANLFCVKSIPDVCETQAHGFCLANWFTIPS